MPVQPPRFEVRLARDADERVLAARLRYEVFVRELGAEGPLVDHALGLEQDRFDPFFDHLLLFDRARPEGDQVVGLYRLMGREGAAAAGRFYSEEEYDLTPLLTSGRPLLELGRSCLHRDYRGGDAMYHLWQGLADHVARRGIGILFGVASFHGTDPARHAAALSLLHYTHLAPAGLRVRARRFQRMDLVPPDRIDRRATMVGIPALIKAYLRLGGFVGEGAYVDHAFNTIDVCLVMDADRLNPRQKTIYLGARAT